MSCSHRSALVHASHEKSCRTSLVVAWHTLPEPRFGFMKQRPLVGAASPFPRKLECLLTMPSGRFGGPLRPATRLLSSPTIPRSLTQDSTRRSTADASPLAALRNLAVASYSGDFTRRLRLLPSQRRASTPELPTPVLGQDPSSQCCVRLMQSRHQP